MKSKLLPLSLYYTEHDVAVFRDKDNNIIFSSPMDKDIAEFIATACNAYHPMLEALEDFVKEINAGTKNLSTQRFNAVSAIHRFKLIHPTPNDDPPEGYMDCQRCGDPTWNIELGQCSKCGFTD